MLQNVQLKFTSMYALFMLELSLNWTHKKHLFLITGSTKSPENVHSWFPDLIWSNSLGICDKNKLTDLCTCRSWFVSFGLVHCHQKQEEVCNWLLGNFGIVRQAPKRRLLTLICASRLFQVIELFLSFLLCWLILTFTKEYSLQTFFYKFNWQAYWKGSYNNNTLYFLRFDIFWDILIFGGLIEID